MNQLSTVIGSVAKVGKLTANVIAANGVSFVNGATYTSAPKKMIGPLHRVTYPHILDPQSLETVGRDTLKGEFKPTGAFAAHFRIDHPKRRDDEMCRRFLEDF